MLSSLRLILRWNFKIHLFTIQFQAKFIRKFMIKLAVNLVIDTKLFNNPLLVFKIVIDCINEGKILSNCHKIYDFFLKDFMYDWAHLAFKKILFYSNKIKDLINFKYFFVFS